MDAAHAAGFFLFILGGIIVQITIFGARHSYSWKGPFFAIFLGTALMYLGFATGHHLPLW